MYTRDLQELKNKQTEVNNTLERIHRKITEEETQINDQEDRMVEITATEQNIEKNNENKWRQPKKPLGQHSHYRGPRRRREKKDLINYLKR